MIRRIHKRVITLINTFFKYEASSGIVLLIFTLLALVIANSPLASGYNQLLSREFTIGYNTFSLTMPLMLWINDGLMPIFFLVVGMEIKRELVSGELNSPKKALLPVAAAFGGMIVPAAIFILLNLGKTTLNGWGIPMATDIAFALGILSLAGKRAPKGIIIFLTALAIADDLGAIIVIAFFYSGAINIFAFAMAMVVFVFLFIMNRLNVRFTAVYIILGILLWICMLKSGVHSTIAGVLLALTIPAGRKVNCIGDKEKASTGNGVDTNTGNGVDTNTGNGADPDTGNGADPDAEVISDADDITDKADQYEEIFGADDLLDGADQYEEIFGADDLLDEADQYEGIISDSITVQGTGFAGDTGADTLGSMLARLEYYLTPFSSFLIMPLFALANAGVAINFSSFSTELKSPVSLGIILGLFIGKQAGIFGTSLLMIRLKLARLPSGITYKHLYGASVLGGIGFTMSVFITSLSFSGDVLSVAKISIMTVSVISAIFGIILFRFTKSASKVTLKQMQK